jgi:two-component system nitrate/nitrite sensor histidine kinase NarX/two-component system sensor histidine kinase UhpB
MGDRAQGNLLCKKADKELSENTETPQKISGDMEKLNHELQVHQIELERQNEELRKAQEEIEASRSRYVELYDFAPVGYFTLDKMGIIMEVNLTGGSLLGIERGRLLKTPFSIFVMAEDRDRFWEYQRKVYKIPGRQSFELRLKRKTGDSIWVGLESVAVEGPDGKMTGVRLTLSEIAERKRSEEALKASEKRFQDFSSKLLGLQEMERKVLANEIHDGFLSDLAGVYYSLEDKIKTLERAGHPMVSDLRKLLKIHQKAINEALRIMNRLRPSTLDELGLIPAITGFCREFKELYPHIHVECKLEAREDEIPDSIKVVIFRVAQEAMTNSIRHGGGDLTKISLAKSSDRVEFMAQDNGSGFDLGTVKKGVGLESMRERVETLGGKFKIESAIGQGTKIQAAWKLS